MGLSSERFCHAAIGRLMDGDRGHWFLTLGSCVWAPTTHSHLSHTHWAPRAKTIEIRNGKKTTTTKKKKKKKEAKSRRTCGRASVRRNAAARQMMSRLFLLQSCPLLLLPCCVIHIQVHSAGVHASPTDTYIYIHRLFIYKYVYKSRD